MKAAGEAYYRNRPPAPQIPFAAVLAIDHAAVLPIGWRKGEIAMLSGKTAEQYLSDIRQRMVRTVESADRLNAIGHPRLPAEHNDLIGEMLEDAEECRRMVRGLDAALEALASPPADELRG